jgi:hypothetical protein
MITAKALWTPYPYKAGFCVTDDTDAATMPQVKAVYDLLLSINFVTTKTVWAFPPSEPSGVPALPSSILEGITLQNEEYLNYCKMLHQNGFEISLHGASAGNNKKDATRAAFDLPCKKCREYILELPGNIAIPVPTIIETDIES